VTGHGFSSSLEHEDSATEGVGGSARDRARAPTPLGTLRNTRSQVQLSMWRGQAWRGRAGQAFAFGELGVPAGTTANSLVADRRGPRQDGQLVKTKVPAGNCLRILNQSLGPTRARYSKNRPLAQPRTMAAVAQGWAGHPSRSRRMRLTPRRTPDPDVDAPRSVTRSSSRNLCLSFDNWVLE
jgi:hypothetical protein